MCINLHPPLRRVQGIGEAGDSSPRSNPSLQFSRSRSSSSWSSRSSWRSGPGLLLKINLWGGAGRAVAARRVDCTLILVTPIAICASECQKHIVKLVVAKNYPRKTRCFRNSTHVKHSVLEAPMSKTHSKMHGCDFEPW